MAKAAYGSESDEFWLEFPVEASEAARSAALEAKPVARRGAAP